MSWATRSKTIALSVAAAKRTVEFRVAHKRAVLDSLEKDTFGAGRANEIPHPSEYRGDSG